MPQAKSFDPNYKLFAEVLSKTKTEFLPYNKSILTRILFSEMKKQNYLLVSHHTKTSLKEYLS